MAARIRPIGPKTPHFGKVEHLRQDAQRPIGLIGDVSIGLVQLGNVRSRHFGHAPPSQLAVDEQGEGAPVFSLSSRLAANEYMLAHEALTQAFEDGRDG